MGSFVPDAQSPSFSIKVDIFWAIFWSPNNQWERVGWLNIWMVGPIFGWLDILLVGWDLVVTLGVSMIVPVDRGMTRMVRRLAVSAVSWICFWTCFRAITADIDFGPNLHLPHPYLKNMVYRPENILKLINWHNRREMIMSRSPKILNN